jgi:hypothetical protein
MKQRKNEVKMYQLHILHSSDINILISKRFIESVKRHNGYLLNPNKVSAPRLFIGTLLFKSPQDRLNFFNENQEFCDMALDMQVALVDKKYL